jgi:hypothetical protein
MQTPPAGWSRLDGTIAAPKWTVFIVRARAWATESERKNRESGKNATNEPGNWRDVVAGAFILAG